MPLASRAGRACKRSAFGTDPIVVVAYGASVDSAALLIGLCNRQIGVDLILFSDTGSEKPDTMAYLPVIGGWLAHQELRRPIA